jgi:hypothetical protein
MLVGEAPADLHAGREVRLERRDGQTDEAGELGDPWHFDHPKTETVALEMLTNSTGERIAFRAIEGVMKQLHHARIAIQGRERTKILFTPRAQAKARAGEGWKDAHVWILADESPGV